MACGCFWTIFCCLHNRRRRLSEARNQARLQPNPHDSDSQRIEMQAQHDEVPALAAAEPGYLSDSRRADVAMPDSTIQPDPTNSTLQEVPPPPYEAAKNYSPPSSSAAFDPTTPQPIPPQFSDFPALHNPSSPPISDHDSPPEDHLAPQIIDLPSEEHP